MAVVRSADLLRRALDLRVPVGAFNITNLEEIEAFTRAAETAQAPLIIQVTGPVCEFLGPEAVAAAFSSRAERSSVPLVLHLDHTTNPDLILEAVRCGFGSVMFDGSRLPYAENVRKTRQVVRRVRAVTDDVTVEGELGTIGGKEDEGAESASRLCKPEDAVGFVTESGIDFFAPAIGTVHGFYKTTDPHVDFARVEAIVSRLEEAGLKVPLVIHGGTGLPPKTVRRLVASGFAKVNISTVIKQVLLDTTYDYIASHREEYNPPRVDAVVREAVVRCVTEQIRLLGTPRCDVLGNLRPNGG